MKLGLKKMSVAAGLGIAALALSACGGGGGARVVPVIVVHDGYWGYYSGVEFCDFVNNYCSTGLAYGITGSGLYYNGEYVTTYVSPGITSPGTTTYISPGTTSPGTTSPGTTYTSPGTTYTSPGTTYTSPGTTSPGTTSPGTTATTSPGTTYTSPGTTYTSPGTTATTSPGTTYTSPGTSYTSPGTSYTSPGTSYTSPGASYTSPGTSYTSPGTSYTSPGTSYTSPSTSSTSSGYTSPGTTSGVAGVDNSTTDVNLMRAMATMDQVNSQASALVNQFPMSFDAARQLVQLSDKMQILQQNNQLSSDDRDAIASAALAVGGVSKADVSDALAKFANGDKSALTNVELKYAHNVGLSDDEMPIVRDQILPQLGVQVPQ